MTRLHSVLNLLCAMLLLLPSTVSAAPLARHATARIPDARFGIIETYHAPADAATSGAGWTRVTFEWNQIQPTGPESWVEYPVADAVLDAERAAGREVVGLLVTAPGWAWAQFGGKNVPAGLELPIDDPGNLWATFVRQMVSRHRNRIRHWIIWNEPDIWGTDFQSWGGTVEEFARLTEVAYRVARESNPNAIIHLPAITHWWDANYGRELFMERLLNALAAIPEAEKYGYFFDAFTLHLYFNVDTIYDLSQHYHGLLHAHGLSKPLWIVETNAPPSNDPAWPIQGPNFNITLEEQAGFMIQGIAMALAAGAERTAIYKMADREGDHVNAEPFGLVRLDGSRRPAFTAYQVATTYLAGFRQANLVRRDNAAIINVRRSNGWTTVAWARGTEAVEVRIRANAQSGRVVNWRGDAKTVRAQGGFYTLTLPASACTHPANPCLIGGEPLMIVEGGVSVGLPAPDPLPAAPGAADPTTPPKPAAPATPATPAPPAGLKRLKQGNNQISQQLPPTVLWC
ncbi:MAG: hypothetical protein JW892_16195 [Anaerolineae bacterium]|nr:hypothetical protein [Anaerolineae bacterium]